MRNASRAFRPATEVREVEKCDTFPAFCLGNAQQAGTRPSLSALLLPDKSNVYGENVLGNSGRTGSKWAEYKSADGYLHQFVEREEGWPYPRNGHESTVVWRATQYVGCADATIRWTAANGADRTCHRVVCRYARPGNCRGREPTFDWEKEAARDHTWCGPICPPEGCFHADP